MDLVSTVQAIYQAFRRGTERGEQTGRAWAPPPPPHGVILALNTRPEDPWSRKSGRPLRRATIHTQ